MTDEKCSVIIINSTGVLDKQTLDDLYFKICDLLDDTYGITVYPETTLYGKNKTLKGNSDANIELY